MDLKALVNIEWGLTSTNILPIVNGLINRTWLVRTPTADFILQNVNTIVFKDPGKLQEQLVRVAAQIELPQLVPLHYIATRKGQQLLLIEGQTFRLARAISPGTTLHLATELNARLAAKALQEFHSALSMLDAQNWKAPIADFLDVAKRMASYESAKGAATPERRQKAAGAIQEIEVNWEKLLNWQHFLENQPQVLIHADPKLSNFLFHPNGKTVRALIDWDTIQLGSPFYDYGDMIRSYCSVGEDVNEDQSVFRKEIYEVIEDALGVDPVALWCAATGVIMVQALRFLTDYLENDRYYRVKDEAQNLRRACNQLKMVQELNAYWLTTQKRVR